jgi:hypothetical protein
MPGSLAKCREATSKPPQTSRRPLELLAFLLIIPTSD